MRKYFFTLTILISTLTLYFVIRKNYLEFNSTISIKNIHWQKVHIQVRKGFNPDPFKNKLIFDQYLGIGQSRTFTIDNGDDILYRRDTDPDHADGIHFTGWQYAGDDEASVCTLDKP